eukprot:292110-Hanusia_phi.AAC.1
MDALEKPHPPPETVAILGNWAGFKFELPDVRRSPCTCCPLTSVDLRQGPNSYAPRVENIESRMDEIPKGEQQGQQQGRGHGVRGGGRGAGRQGGGKGAGEGRKCG